MQLYSFDVFDTIITRNTATPAGIFALMQKRLLSESGYVKIDTYIRRNFYNLRIQAETLAKSSFLGNGIEDITLEQIYEAMGLTGCLNRDGRNMLAALERQTEIENSRGIRRNIEKVSELLRNGNRVIFISNMYLDDETVRKMLHKADAGLDKIPLYVSAQCKKIKNTGNLYQFVQEREMIDFSEWIHCGDNRKVDVEAPGRLGIKGIHYNFESLLPWEKELMKCREDDAQIQLIVGASRNARLQQKENDSYSGKKTVPYGIGTSIGGGILFPYVWWILNESIKRGIKKLYFIARDGYLLKQMADIIIKLNHMDIKTFYLYGSREAWRMPAFIGRNISMKKLIIWSHPSRIRSFDMLANVLGISEKELLELLGLSGKKQQQPLTAVGLYNAVEILQKNENYWKLLSAKYADKCRRTGCYLAQEVNRETHDTAFVEVAGSGFTQGCLAELMKEEYRLPIRTFYFKMDKMPFFEGCIFYDFIPGMMQFPLLIELLTRAPHGQTKDYEEQESGWKPVLKDKEEQAFLDYGLQDYLQGVTDFTMEYAGMVKKYDLQADDLSALKFYMEATYDKKYRELLDFFGEMPDSMTGWETCPVPFAPKLNRMELEEYKQMGWDAFISRYKGSCLEYSLLRCTEEETAFLKQENEPAKSDNPLKEQPEYQYGATIWFPTELLGDRVVLYGAGRAGRDLYHRIKRETASQIVLWVDNNWKECLPEDGLEITSVEKIKSSDYDQIVMTILDRNVARRLGKELVEAGIREDKVLIIDYQIHWD